MVDVFLGVDSLTEQDVILKYDPQNKEFDDSLQIHKNNSIFFTANQFMTQ